MKEKVFVLAAFAVVLIRCAPALGFVLAEERGTWPEDWPKQLDFCRDLARSFAISTDVRENVYEIRPAGPEEFERIWPTILRLRGDGASLRVCRGEASATGGPIIRLYTPAYGGSAQRPGGRMLPVGPPWPNSIRLPNGLLPEYVVISADGTRWVPAVGGSPRGLRHRARIEIELAADDRTFSFDRVLVPPETPVVDNRHAPQARPVGTWYVAPHGQPENSGTADSPWDLASTLSGQQQVVAGDTIYLCQGVYRRRPKELFEVRLKGAAWSPIRVRPAPGQVARIDGGLSIQRPSAYLWIEGIEIFVSEPMPAEPTGAGSDPPDLKRPNGGLHMHGGVECKYINLTIHHCSQGISCWKDEINPEIYGCVIYGNGWLGVDRGHGHCIYTQNDEGVKTISNCIMTCPHDGSYTVHAYGSEQAYVNNFLLTDNVCYGKGPFLVGGGRPSRGIHVSRNSLYGVDMRIGYNAPYNDDCEIRDNTVVNGKLEVSRYRKSIWEGNLVIPTNSTTRTIERKSVLLPNKYDRNRGHLAIFNWSEEATVDVETTGFMAEGDTAELFDPQNLFGYPVATVVSRSGMIRVPVPEEFAVFVIRVRRQ